MNLSKFHDKFISLSALGRELPVEHDTLITLIESGSLRPDKVSTNDHLFFRRDRFPEIRATIKHAIL